MNPETRTHLASIIAASTASALSVSDFALSLIDVLDGASPEERASLLGSIIATAKRDATAPTFTSPKQCWAVPSAEELADFAKWPNMSISSMTKRQLEILSYDRMIRCGEIGMTLAVSNKPVFRTLSGVLGELAVTYAEFFGVSISELASLTTKRASDYEGPFVMEE